MESAEAERVEKQSEKQNESGVSHGGENESGDSNRD